jgi:sterol desaturase/sphingolipid hydroxylase (fatty acid hydroxylase superfamily)
MANPWKSKPVLICATPIVAALLQVIILGYATGMTANAQRNSINNAITLAVLFIPVLSIPALAAAVGALKTKALRGWYVAGAVLNSAYCLLLAFPILFLVNYFIHRRS